jgi:hypothetical protein
MDLALELLGANKLPRATPQKPKHSEITFADVATAAGVSQATIGKWAAAAHILPPLRSDIEGLGRPKLETPGTGKKIGPRSPHRARAQELKKQGLSLRVIAERITAEVRAKATTLEEKEFKISGEAIRQLLVTDENK